MQVHLVVIIYLFVFLCLPVYASESNTGIPNRKDDIQKYLEQRWTPNRIKQFCQPETRYFGVKTVRSKLGRTIGQLHRAKESQLGKVIWYFDDHGNGEGDFEILVDKAPDYWQLEISTLTFGNFSETDFKKHLILEKLKHSFFTWDLLNNKVTPKNEKISDFNVAVPSALIEKPNGLMEWRGILINGKKVKVNVRKDFSIEQVLVDGKPNKYWNIAIRDARKNVNEVVSKCSNCGVEKHRW